MRDKKIAIIILVLIIIVPITVPIVIVNNVWVKNITLLLLGNKENAYQYMQFVGSFLGTVITVIGAIMTVRYQIFSESNAQKHLNRQSFIRNEISQQIIIMKLKINNIRAEILSVGCSAKWALKYKEEELLNNKEYREDVKRNYNNETLQYSNEKAIFKVLLENYEFELSGFTNEFNNTIYIIDELDKYIRGIGMSVSAFPGYTDEMMEILSEDTNNAYKLCEDLYKSLDGLYKELNKYYEKEL